MKITQLFSSLLMGENFIFSTVFAVIFSFIEIYLYSLILSVFLDTKLTRKKQFIFIITLVFSSTLTSLLIPSPYYPVVNVFLSILLSYFIFKMSFLKVAFATFCFYALTFFINVIWATLYTLLFNCSTEVLNEVLLYRIIFSVSTYVSYYIFYRFAKKYNINIRLFSKLENHKAVILNLVVGLTTIITQFVITFLYFDYIPLPLTIFSSMILLSYFLISVFSLYRTNKLEITSQLLEEEKLYNKTLSTLHDNIRGFKHDFNNIVQSIGGYISSNNMPALKLYYNDLLADCQINNNLAGLDPESINNPALYSLLSDKYYKASKVDVKIELTILTDLSHLKIKDYELTRILGILLDNAIEASLKANDKKVNIIFMKDKNVDRDLIIIENTYENKNINLDKIFEKGYTSKSDNDKSNHGLGLWEVKKFIKKRKNLNLETNINDIYFIQKFEIFNNT